MRGADRKVSRVSKLNGITNYFFVVFFFFVSFWLVMKFYIDWLGGIKRVSSPLTRRSIETSSAPFSAELDRKNNAAQFVCDNFFQNISHCTPESRRRRHTTTHLTIKMPKKKLLWRAESEDFKLNSSRADDDERDLKSFKLNSPARAFEKRKKVPWICFAWPSAVIRLEPESRREQREIDRHNTAKHNRAETI